MKLNLSNSPSIDYILIVSGLRTFCKEYTLYNFSSLNLSRFVLWFRIKSILMNVLRILERKVCSALVRYSGINMLIIYHFVMFFRSSILCWRLRFLSTLFTFTDNYPVLFITQLLVYFCGLLFQIQLNSLLSLSSESY